ncbi:MAG: hypothetical protein H7236_12610 [Gemmatimonadaceae bacterium]|nr:hypothetical protein [Caulobacter sp.]
MAQSDDIATPTASLEDLEIAKVLEQSRQDSEAGLSLRGDGALTYLQKLLDQARAQVLRQTG